MTKKIYLIVFALFLLACLVGCADSANSSPTESPTEAKDESYRIEKIDGQYYIIFADESAFENPPPFRNDAISGAVALEIGFGSVEEMYRSLTEGTLSYGQKYWIVKYFDKDDIGYLLPDLDHLLIPDVQNEFIAFSDNVHTTDGRFYYLMGMPKQENLGVRDVKFFCYTEDAFHELYAREYSPSREALFVDSRTESADGSRVEIIGKASPTQGGEPTADTHEIHYSLQSDGEIINARLSAFAHNPLFVTMDVFVQGDGCFYRYTMTLVTNVFFDMDIREEELLSFSARVYEADR